MPRFLFFVERMRFISKDLERYLDLNTDRAFSHFRTAASHYSPIEGSKVNHHYKLLDEALRRDIICKYISKLPRHGTFEKWIVQAAIAWVPGIIIEKRFEGIQQVDPKTEGLPALDDLTDAIDDSKSPYANIQRMTFNLARAHHYDMIFKALEYARGPHITRLY